MILEDPRKSTKIIDLLIFGIIECIAINIVLIGIKIPISPIHFKLSFRLSNLYVRHLNNPITNNLITFPDQIPTIRLVANKDYLFTFAFDL